MKTRAVYRIPPHTVLCLILPLFSLWIINAQHTDSGVYYCVSSNAIGQASTKIYLQVLHFHNVVYVSFICPLRSRKPLNQFIHLRRKILLYIQTTMFFLNQDGVVLSYFPAPSLRLGVQSEE